jgi:hypothetical protein
MTFWADPLGNVLFNTDSNNAQVWLRRRSLKMRNDDLTDEDDFLESEDIPENTVKILSKGSKAWRSIERYREMKELRNRLEDLLYDDIADDLKDLRW